jgi:hypothetical protein
VKYLWHIEQMDVRLSIKAKLVIAASAAQELKSTSESIEVRMPRLQLSDQRRSEWSESIAARHDLVAMGRYFCGYPRKEVNRPEAVRSSEKKRQVRNLKPQAPSIARPRA